MNFPHSKHIHSLLTNSALKAARHRKKFIRKVWASTAHSACLGGAITLALSASSTLAQTQGGYVRPSLIQGNAALINNEEAVKEALQQQAQQTDQVREPNNSKTQKKISQKSASKPKKQRPKFPYKVKDWEVALLDRTGAEVKACVARSTGAGAGSDMAPASITLEVDQQSIRVLTDAEIDAYQQTTGLRIDTASISPFDEVLSSTNIRFSLDYLSLIAKMRKGQQAELVLGFWPTQAPSPPSTYRVSLAGFSAAMEKLEQCRHVLAKS